jgi:ACT domain-containing protein
MPTLVTVMGKDRKGIIAGISAEMSNVGINILDITQTVMGEKFVMIMLVDMKGATENFDKIQEQLDKKGSELGVRVRWDEDLS